MQTGLPLLNPVPAEAEAEEVVEEVVASLEFAEALHRRAGAEEMLLSHPDSAEMEADSAAFPGSPPQTVLADLS